MGLTVKQHKFVTAYVESGNATQAALDAGYSKRTARSIGQENLTKPDIKQAIDDLMQQLEDNKIAKADEVLQFFTSVLRGDATETVNIGTPQGVITIDDSPPTNKDRMIAGKELLKRYPNSDDQLQAKLRKLTAEAEIAEARSKALQREVSDDDERTMIVDDVPDTDEDPPDTAD
jgi:phage terminase small subunit